jgi:asparagine synthase (glutamine-hydrolysing)
MCGIIGYFSKGNWQPDPRAFEEATNLMTHRGPDQLGIWTDPQVGLGFRRLSIIDLNTGNQPMTNEDGSLHIVFNGEIYNFRELRKELEGKGHRFQTQSDTETILHLYEDIGECCVDRLRGMFAFAIYNSREQTLFLARDRFGKKPLIYTETDKAFYFASEIKPLLQLSGVRRSVNLDAIQAYLAFRYIPGHMTAWKYLKRLQPASRMRIHQGAIQKIERYWNLPERDSISISEKEALDQLKMHLEESVKLRMISDVPLGAFLSGGIDSSVTVAAMTRCSSNVKTFCIGFENPRFDESSYARDVAKRLGTDHHELRVAADSLDALDPLLEISGEPFADQSILPTHLLSKFTRSKVTVALSGDGGDELFSGYKRYQHLAKAARISKLGIRGLWLASSYALFKAERLINPKRKKLRWPRSAVDHILPLSPLHRYAHLVASWHHGHRARFFKGFKTLFSRTDYLQQFLNRGSRKGAFSPWQILDLETYLPDDILRKVDWASMACSLECRNPFLDHPLVEWVAELPSEFVSGARSPKNLLKKIYPEIFPKSFFEREKKGFSMPIGDWMKNQWKDKIQSSLDAPWNSGMKDFFNQDVLFRIWNEHQEGIDDHGDRLWTWHVLARWNEIFKPEWGN